MNLKGIATIKELLRKADMNGYVIYCDLDGVLNDFDKEFKKLGKGTPEEYDAKYGTSAIWKLINQKTDHFWLEMEWMPDGKKLWDFIKNFDPILLTTPARSVKNCKADKQAWVEREISKDIIVIMSGKKYEYADKNTILIDDMPKNIMPWREAGGIGILHESAEKTIEELQKILKK